MVRRYAPDGARLWNGKRPEDFMGEDVRAFLFGAPSPQNGGNNDMADKNIQTAAGASAVETQDTDKYLLMEAPIAEMAEAFNLTVDEAVQARVNAAVFEATEVAVNVRPIEPRGKLIAMADVSIGGMTVEGFKVFNGDNGLFVGEPSMPDKSTRSGFRRTARISDDLKPILNDKALEGYNGARDRLVARAAAAQAMEVKPSIREELQKGAEQAAKANAARSTPEKAGKATRDDR